MKENKASTLTVVLTQDEKRILDQIKEDLGEKTSTKVLKMLLQNYARFIDTNTKYAQLQKDNLKLQETIREREKEYQTEMAGIKTKIGNFILSFDDLRNI